MCQNGRHNSDLDEGQTAKIWSDLHQIKILASGPLCTREKTIGQFTQRQNRSISISMFWTRTNDVDIYLISSRMWKLHVVPVCTRDKMKGGGPVCTWVNMAYMSPVYLRVKR